MVRFFKTVLLVVLAAFFASTASYAQFTLVEQPDIALPSDFNASALCRTAEKTGDYLATQPNDSFAVHAGHVFDNNVTVNRVKQTLDFLCQTYREDVRAKRNSRLHDVNFLKQHFDFYQWQPDKAQADKLAGASTNKRKAELLRNIPNDQILLTKYYTKLLDGSEERTEKYNQALYALPFDEQSLSLEQAETLKTELTRFKYTRQQVIDGVLLERQLAKPLIWLTEEALHDVLLQGTGVLKVNGSVRYFNVHRNNDIAYDYTIGKREQARYWYFAEVPSIMGYGQTLADKIAIDPQVTFAGNLADLGLGKLVMVSYTRKQKQISRLGILADQGGAFNNNLFQLDLLVGNYRGWQDYYQDNKHLPDYAKAWILIVKDQKLNLSQ